MTLEDISNIDFKPAKYANQKSIYTNKANDGTYGIIRVDANIEAVRNLKNEGQAYALWMYLNCNQDGYIEAFSPQHIANLWDMDVKTVRRAFAALEKHGYLENIGQNHYIFYESLLDNTNMDKVVHVDKVVHMDNVVQVNKNNEIKNQHGQSCPHNMDNLVHPTWTKLSTNMDKVVHSNITYNTYNNTIDNTKLSSHNSSTEVENCFKESNVYTSCIDGEDDIDKVNSILSKEEERKIYTTDGDTFNLPIENILSGLKLVLANKQNEGVIREIREKCDLTEEQKKEIDDTLDFWELDW